MTTPEHQIGQMPLALGGKAYTLFFDYTFLSIIRAASDGKSIEEIGATEPFRLVPLITLSAIKAGDDVNDVSDLPTERQISRMLMATGPETNKAILDNFNASMGFIGAVYGQIAVTANAVAGSSEGK